MMYGRESDVCPPHYRSHIMDGNHAIKEFTITVHTHHAETHHHQVVGGWLLETGSDMLYRKNVEIIVCIGKLEKQYY